eukprot:CAMPEP_0114424938 /NCGR_PEP_ID=MMETSP0103-20121206/6962_1 /TAXON_ID=37642 ORGANISM="Paraphysomonas imperforata, Strain PA2" /NCGR_SAMPLE_ID=MMETSP0103 /ASSEMBLY_ACC=CAM_ASM_000201 /LENGTH=1014 /DNA_ID=CAMNT_0001593727 /DNA_START=244 /DNA_END=3288 /DNA_ORIENTATION=-
MACSQSLRSDPHNPDALRLRGGTYLKMERYQEAVADFSALLSVDPASVEIYYKRGMAYSRLDAHDAAIADFTRVLSMNPSHVNAAFARAASYNTIGQFSQAIEDYNTALLQDQSAVTPSRPTTPIPKPAASHRLTPSSSGRERYRGPDVDQGTSSPAAELGVPFHTSDSSRVHQNRPRRGGAEIGTGTGSATQREPSRQPPLGSPPFSPQRGVQQGGRQAFSTQRDGVDRVDSLLPSPPGRVRHESEDDNSTVISGITFMSNTKGYPDSPGDSSFSYLPLSSDEYHQKGYEFRRQGKFESAVEEYSKALQKDPRHFKALFNRAFAMDKLGEHKEAIRDYSRALDVDPTNAYAFYNRGISHDRQKNYVEASADFKRAIELSPNNLDFLHNLALCLRKMGQTRDALETYSQCLKLDPAHVKARHGRAMCNETLRMYDHALRDYDAILAQNPQHMLCMVSRAHLLHRMSSQEDGAATRSPRDTDTDMPDYSQEAYQSFSASLDILCPDVQALISSVDNVSSATSATGSVGSQSNGHINRCTESISILYARAKILEDRGDNEGAIEDLTSAIHLASALLKVQESHFTIPKSSMSSNAVDLHDHPCLSLYLLFYNRALGWKACDQYRNAMTDLTTTLKLIIDEKNTLLSVRDADSGERMEVLNNALNNAYNHRGFCFRKVENFNEAIADYTKAIRALPDNARALNNRAYCYAKKDMYAEAVADYTRVIDIDPFNSHSYHNRGISLDKLGKSDAALADFAKVIELDSSSNQPDNKDHIDISHSFRERYIQQDAGPGPSTPSSQHLKQASMTSSGGVRIPSNQTDLHPGAFDNDIPRPDSERVSPTARTLTRKPRRPPPARPTKPPSPGPFLTQQPMTRGSHTGASEQHLQRNGESTLPSPSPGLYSPQQRARSAGRSGRQQRSPPATTALDTLASSLRHQNTTTGGGRGVIEGRPAPSPSFEPIRMSSRGNTPKRNKSLQGVASPERSATSSADRGVGSSRVQNSYNSRSFVNHDGGFQY